MSISLTLPMQRSSTLGVEGLTASLGPDYSAICYIANLQDPMERYDRLLRISLRVIENRKVGFSELSNLRRGNLHHVIRCTSVSVSYDVILGIFPIIPTKFVQDILERMNHGLFINIGMHVTSFSTTKTLLIRLPRFWRSVFLNERILHARRDDSRHSL
jgi:hypothetical protein